MAACNFITDWRQLLANSIHSPEQLEVKLSVSSKALSRTTKIYPMRLNPYFASLIQRPNDPIWRQTVADPKELEDDLGQEDPLCEEQQSKVPNVIHRYPNRVVFIVSDRCAVYCRHCMRKRRVGASRRPWAETIRRGIDYIAATPLINDVVLSGGDPLLLEDQAIFDILERLRRINHVKIIRIHSRVPCALPQRITEDLVHGLRKFHPLWLNIQFNHAMEITAQATAACSLLADAGIPLGCQTVLLKGVNDSAETIAELMERLLQIRVRPYYIHHPDRIKGTRHFWISPEKGLAIMAKLRGHLSGLAVPHYMLDLPGGGGKVSIFPEAIVEKRADLWRIRNHNGKIFDYPLDPQI